MLCSTEATNWLAISTCMCVPCSCRQKTPGPTAWLVRSAPLMAWIEKMWLAIAASCAAALLAQKKRLGPWSNGSKTSADPLIARKAHEKAVAAMLRAGHQYDHVRFVLAASSAQDVEQWLDEAADQEGQQGIW